jgi:tRNA-2-methylthio-N6-dimethylallyladenosine synthase
MNRGYAREEYLERVIELRKACPQISITTDLIVGFPGEAEADFQSTLEVVEQVQFDDLFSFKYSDRPYTRAAEFQDKVPEEVSRRRLMELQARQRRITVKHNKTWEGREVEVLVEGWSKENTEENMGRTRTNHIVNFPGADDPIGSLVQLRIVKVFAHSLRGERIV